MKLTSFENGMNIEVNDKKIEAYGPHSSGGSFIIVDGNRYHVSERVNELLTKSAI